MPPRASAARGGKAATTGAPTATTHRDEWTPDEPDHAARCHPIETGSAE
jgi:hypothetical protein